MTDSERIERLERVIAAPREMPRGENSTHPMRLLTEDIVRHDVSWTPASARSAGAFFDELAPGWESMFEGDSKRFAALGDALDRGGPINFGTVADIGAGTAASTLFLQNHFGAAIGLDLSYEMLRRGSSDAPRVQADGAYLPLGDASVDAVVLLNAFLFPAEVGRILRPDGVIVWVSSMGDSTPIYLSADEVADSLPGSWVGVQADAWVGSWAVLRRA